MGNEGVNKSAKKKTKLIQFECKNKPELLTENEINNLFLGFVRLIKKNVVFQKEKQYKLEINYYNKLVADYALELKKKNDEIDKLKKIIQLNNLALQE